MHPSIPHNGEEDGPDPEEPFLPDGVSQEQVDDLITKISEKLNLLGLYVEPSLQVTVTHDHDVDGSCGKDFIVLHVMCRIGRVAFSTRVQDPEQAKMNDSFTGIVTDEQHSKADEIRKRFSRGDQDPT